ARDHRHRPEHVPARPASRERAAHRPGSRHEYGLLVDRGAAELSAGDRETTVASRELMVLPDGARRLEIRAADGEDFRAMLLGGEPLGEDITMWWNFVGRTHEAIVAVRAGYPAEV